MDATGTLQRVIDSDVNIAILDTPETDRVLSLFKRLTLTTGRAVYDWTPDNGLYRLGIEHIFIPRTRAPADVIAYIAASRHYGIYLLRDFETALAKPSIQQALNTISAKDDGVRRLVILVGESLRLPDGINGRVARVRQNVKERRRTGTSG